jgi:hypothetical protein
MTTQPQPVAISVAIGGILTTGVALAAILFQLDPILQAAIIAFGNSIILTGSIIYAQRRVTPLSAPRLTSGTEVSVIDAQSKATGDKVVIAPSPPGPIGIEGEPPPGG